MRLVSALTLILILLSSVGAHADCAKDLYGEVFCGAGKCLTDRDGKIWCSRYQRGDAHRTLDGVVVCGKGQCTPDSRGRVFCSTEIDGAVLIDSTGRVRCDGACERASEEMCESTVAGSSE